MKQTKYYVCDITTMHDGVEFSTSILIETYSIVAPTEKDIIKVFSEGYKHGDEELREEGKWFTDDCGFAFKVDKLELTFDGLILKDYLTTIVL